MSDIEEIKQRLKENKKSLAPKRGVSSGSTLLNLACTGDPDVGFFNGHYYLFVGDSQAGKSWLAMTVLAEACINPSFDKYRLIHDNPERGVLMDYQRYFGNLGDRLESPSNRGSSKTLEDFYDNIDDISLEGKPFIYVLDSEDALQTETDIKKNRKDKKSRRKEIEDGEAENVKTTGSYGTDKAKKNSAGLRMAHNCLEETDSMLFVIKQTRDNIGFDAMFNPKVRSGGRALTFYATLELWFSIVGKIKKTIKGKKRSVGTELKIQVKKNRIVGGDHNIDIPFYPSCGLDDVGSCVNFLVEENHWSKSGSSVTAKDLDFKGTEEKLIEMIELNNLEKDLRRITAETWKTIEESCQVNRKNRYSQSLTTR